MLPTLDPAPPDVSVLVLGAGMAGLSCADLLHRAGYRVTVLEAQRRAGGRVHTLREEFSEGLHVEAGANRFPDCHPLTLACCNRLGLELVDFQHPDLPQVCWLENHRFVMDPARPTRWPVPMAHDEECESPGQLEGRYIGPWLDRLGDPLASDWPPERYRHLDGQSYADFLRQQGASEGAIAVLSCNFNVGEGLEHASALWMLRNHALDRDRKRLLEIPGGNDRLPEALARELSPILRYGCPVTRIEPLPDRVRVTIRQAFEPEVLEAHYAVCTLPYPVLKDLDVPLSPARRRVAEQLPYASMTKVFLQCRRRFWEDSGLSGFATTDRPMTEIWNVTVSQSGTRGVLLAYSGGAESRRLTAMTEELRVSTTLERMAEVYPDLKVHFEGGLSWCWDLDPWSGGAGAWYGVGQWLDFQPDLAGPQGRLHFAGEHTSP
ncbi:MAG: NAD(P)/FAD-dependent oxidoreductase, partial [Candidatus Eremiobacterota bacterium]